MRNASPIAVQVYTLLRTKGVGPAKVAKLLRWVRDQAADLTNMLKHRRKHEQAFLRCGIPPEFLEPELSNVDDEVRALADEGIELVSILEQGYPPRLREVLGREAPPLLAIRGNRSLLAKPAAGFCGSRDASAKGLETARDCAEQLARSGIVVASGYARGVDRTTHRAALEAGGATVVVLAEGILKFTVKRDVKPTWDWGRAVVLSEFLPKSPWRVANAMRRNLTICALSRSMILIEARETGGSMAAGKACLKIGLPLFAPVYEGMPEEANGNRILLQQGARPLRRNRDSGRANLQPVIDVFMNGSAVNDRHHSRRRDEQLSLLD